MSCLRTCCNGNDGVVLKGQLTLCSKFISAAVRSKQACMPYGLAVLLLLPLISVLASAPGSYHSPCGWSLQLLCLVSCRAGHGTWLPSFHHVITWRPNVTVLPFSHIQRRIRNFYMEIRFDVLIWCCTLNVCQRMYKSQKVMYLLMNLIQFAFLRFF